jgi:hypothetical protein
MKKIALVLTALLVLTGCSAGNKSSEATPSASATTNPYGGGFVVDPPADSDVVLSIKGASTKDFTMGEITALADEEITINEPFVKIEQSFKVVKMEKLLAGLGFKPTDTLSTVALNDYAFPDTVANFTNNNAYIAVSRNGAAIPMDQGGPIRIIFASDSGYFTNLDAWNWSIRTIEIAKP